MNGERRKHDTEVKRLHLLNLKQGGLVLRQLELARREMQAHAKQDNEQFSEHAEKDAELEVELGKLKTEIGWIRRIGIWALTAFGLGHLLSAK